MAAAGEQSRLLRERASTTAESSTGEERYGDGAASASADDIQRALHCILDSPEFRSVVQLRSFLNYVVTKTIENRTSEIKGYTIAVEALGRDSSFDPVSDPIVRVEAARLRRRLEKYYEGSGNEDPLLIEIPKGSYAPKFSNRTCEPLGSGTVHNAGNASTADGHPSEINANSEVSNLAQPDGAGSATQDEPHERQVAPPKASYYPPKTRLTFDMSPEQHADGSEAHRRQAGTYHLSIGQTKAAFILVATFFAGLLTGYIL